MSHKRNTKFGEVEFSIAMFDLDGTNLEEGVEVRLDGELIKELYGSRVERFDEMSTEQIELFLKENCDL